jgi:diguanylate cyclase (GGDEF)-like protein
VRAYAPIGDRLVTWWVLAVAIVVTERWVVHLEFRRSAHTFSLTDVPISLGLIFATGPQLMLGVLLGAAAALVLRRQPPIKFAFNLSHFLLTAGMGAVIVHVLAADHGFGPLAWLGVCLARQVAGVTTILLILAAIWLSEGRPSREQVRQMFGMDAAVIFTTTCLALVVAVVVVANPLALPLLVVPIVAVFATYRAYVSERLRHEKLEFLYEANRALSESPAVALALEGLLSRAIEAFRAEFAEVLLFAADGGAPLRTTLTAGGAIHVMEPAPALTTDAVRAVAADLDGATALDEPFPEALRVHLRDAGVHGGMLAALEGKERVIGAIVLGNRVGIARDFSRDDLKLFETLAANTSAALQYDRLEQAVSELHELQQKLRHQAYHDPLTGLANRSLFEESVQGALAGDRGDDVAVLFIDLDDFKTVNDTLGHAIGDQLLLGVAGVLRESVPDCDLVARLGGDEFAVLVVREGDAERAGVELARKLQRVFESAIQTGESLLSVHASIGVAATRHSGTGSTELLRDADVAMYQAKDRGKGRYAVFSPVMREAIVRRHGLTEDLKVAINQGELFVQYQPIVALGNHAAVAVEGLVRWQHPVRGVVSPVDFIPVAEETGLIVPLGRTVLEDACHQARAWMERRPGTPPLHVHVNLSALELEDASLVDGVADAIERHGIEPHQLVLEMTETLLVQDAQRGAARLQQLRDVGVRLALDDFGTGYSSLSYLRSLPLDILKIAKPFVDGLGEGEDVAFVRLIVELARSVGLSVVAEGIETPAQLAALQALRCDYGQGFFFAPPLDAEAAFRATQRGDQGLPRAA